MANFAEVDENKIVKRVIVINDNELIDNGIESEAKGIAFCQSLFGSNWVQTSGNIRYNYAGIGYTYDSARDAFIPPKNNCHPEESLDEATCRWVCTNQEHEVVIDGNN